MATAKKKTAAKSNVKYAAKAQSSARATSPASSAKQAGNSWVSANQADWQKGASDWAKQSAKLYQLPFAQNDVNAATKKAAESVKSATENMVKMSSDMMSQMFNQQAKPVAAQAFDPAAMFKQFQTQMPKMPEMPKMPAMDMGAAGEKLSKFAQDSSEQMSKASQSANRASAEAMEVSRDNLEAATEVLNLATSVSKELAADMINFMNKQFAQNVELSKQALTCRTLNDMFDLSTRITKSNLDGFFSQSVKVSEMIFQCATDVSEPINDRISESTARLSKVMAS
ncbi:MAG: phasin family protein [Rickettsiales bacterium]|nr:phasin family protein [Rickettsiales bacterium]